MIRYVKGDATDPQGSGAKVIVHCCNDENKWGQGFVLALSAKWTEPEAAYRRMTARRLGMVEFVAVDLEHWQSPLYVANLIGQHGTRSLSNPTPIRYGAIHRGLLAIERFCTQDTPVASVHMPRMGAGLAGGNWDVIEDLIEDALVGINVTVYDL